MKVIRNQLFGKYYLFMTLVVIVFVALGLITSRLAQRFSPSPVDDHHAVFYARLLDSLAPGNRAAGLAKLRALNATGSSVVLNVVDASGHVIAPPGDTLPYDWSAMRKPQGPYEFESVRSPFRTIMLLPGEPPEYLSVASVRDRRSLVPSLLFSSTFAALAVSVLLGIGLSMVMLFHSLREKAALADSIITELQRGNLKARFPVARRDEVGRAMGRFNRMADEIERLVEQLKSVERTRMRLLQDLAHDLRTPLASLKNSLETLQSAGSRIDGKTRDELMTLSSNEVSYLERLVEDLLTLAQVSEPRYQEGQDLVSIEALLVDEAESIATSSRGGRRSISLIKSLPSAGGEELRVRGNALLLRRMIRNVLDNAFSFATAEVRIALTLEPADADRAAAQIVLTVEDDGLGFSAQALESYGERRATRIMNRNAADPGTERLSVGLGSVISKTVAHVHGGRVEASNRDDATGARVVIRLPLG